MKEALPEVNVGINTPRVKLQGATQGLAGLLHGAAAVLNHTQQIVGLRRLGVQLDGCPALLERFFDSPISKIDLRLVQNGCGSGSRLWIRANRRHRLTRSGGD